MTTDYAKKKPQPKSKRGLWFFLQTLILICFATTLIVVYKHHQKKHPTKKTAAHQTKKIQAHKQKPIEIAKKQNFDFYSMLPSMKVAVKKQSPHAVQLTSGQTYYLLQVATTSDQKAAQLLTTKLGVMGVNAYLKPYTSNKGNTLYRVLVGPYTSKKGVTTDKAYLQSNHISSMLLSRQALNKTTTG